MIRNQLLEKLFRKIAIVHGALYNLAISQSVRMQGIRHEMMPQEVKISKRNEGMREVETGLMAD